MCSISWQIVVDTPGSHDSKTCSWDIINCYIVYFEVCRKRVFLGGNVKTGLFVFFSDIALKDWVLQF